MRLKYDQAALKSVSSRYKIPLNEVRKRAQYYRFESDWRYTVRDKPIVIKTKVFGVLEVLTGSPLETGKNHYKYEAKCTRCGWSGLVSLSVIQGRTPSICDDNHGGGSYPSRYAATRAKAKRKAEKQRALLQTHSALVVRAHEMCGGCLLQKRCSDVLYECDCLRRNDDGAREKKLDHSVRLNSKMERFVSAVAAAGVL